MSCEPRSSRPVPLQARTEAAERLWGSGSVEAAFSSDRRVVPWPLAPRRKGQPYVAQEDMARLLTGPPALVDLDPRLMHATQTFCVASHVRYYLTETWERTGITSADPGVASNRYPLVWIDGEGRQIVLGGHHRSLAALLDGRPVRCRVLRTDPDGALALLPVLLIGESASVPTTATDDAATAARLVARRQTVLVPDLDTGQRVLAELGLSEAAIADRTAMASTGRTAAPD